MRLSVITNWAYGATVALTLVSGATMVFATDALERERTVFERSHRLQRAAASLDEEVLHLSDRARQYLDTRDPTYLAAYRSELASLDAAEKHAERLTALGATPGEIDYVSRAIRLAELLRDEQQASFEAFDRGDTALARRLLFGAEYERQIDRIVGLIERMESSVENRVQVELAAAERTARLWRTVSETMLAITGLLFLAVLYFVIRRRVVQPVIKLSDVVRRLAENDFAAEPPEIDQIDEIGDMAQAIASFRENGLERQRLERQRAADGAVRERISRMSQRLQTCDRVEEIADIVRLFAPRIAPDLAGRLYLFDRDRNLMVESCHWNAPRLSVETFAPLHCWALRRGLPHRPGGEVLDMPCQHLGIDVDVVPDTFCLPLMAQQETVGLLYFERVAEGEASVAMSEPYLGIVSESIGMALANLALRDRLQELALKDPLTNLGNRRELDRQVALLADVAERAGTRLSCLMIDVDHFKRFNDTYGHEAGDAVLREVGRVLASVPGGRDLAFRYGGEEFTVLLPGVDVDAASATAEDIRRRICNLQLEFAGQDLGSISVSVGVSTLSTARDGARLVTGADGALLRAKEAGRNRVAVDRRDGERDKDETARAA